MNQPFFGMENLQTSSDVLVVVTNIYVKSMLITILSQHKFTVFNARVRIYWKKAKVNSK